MSRSFGSEEEEGRDGEDEDQKEDGANSAEAAVFVGSGTEARAAAACGGHCVHSSGHFLVAFCCCWILVLY